MPISIIYSDTFHIGCQLRLAFNFLWWALHLRLVWVLSVVLWPGIVRGKKKPECCFPQHLGLDGWRVVPKQPGHLLDLRLCNIITLVFLEHLEQRGQACGFAGLFVCLFLAWCTLKHKGQMEKHLKITWCCFVIKLFNCKKSRAFLSLTGRVCNWAGLKEEKPS